MDHLKRLGYGLAFTAMVLILATALAHTPYTIPVFHGVAALGLAYCIGLYIRLFLGLED